MEIESQIEERRYYNRYLIGNITLKTIILSYNSKLTNESVPYTLEVIQKSCIIMIDVLNSRIGMEKRNLIEEALRIPINEREIAIKSNSKSAAKTSLGTFNIC